MRAWIALAVVAACSGGGGRPAQPQLPEVPDAQAAAATTDAPVASFPGAPATRAGHALGWVLDAVITRKGAVDVAELEAHFHPSFLAAVPAAQLQSVMATLGPQLATARLGAVTGDELTLQAELTGGPAPLVVRLVLDAGTGLVTGLVFEPSQKLGPKPTSFAEAETMLATIAPHASLYVARLDRGQCKPQHVVGTRAPLAIGSVFKLYVLLGLVDRIRAGKATWEDELAVRDDWKSLPSGVTQDDPAGTKLTLRTLAERMIAISDNTATDHLLYALGRQRVEAAMRSTRPTQPARNLPFLSTRELFLLKLGDPAALDAYLARSPAQRRVQLDRTLAGMRPTLEGVEAWSTARAIDRLEWFATGADLCRLMGTLWQRAQQPAGAPLLPVLAKNPGLPLGPATWPYIGFKGGSEPGVLAMTYLLKRVDGTWFVVAITFNADAGGTVDEGAAVGYVQGVIELLGAPDLDQR